MRKTILSLTAVAALAGGITAIGTGAASADQTWNQPKGGSNCVTDSEKAHLRVGMSPGDVRRVTGANAWLSVNDEYNGTPVRVEAFNACAPHADKALAAMYRIDGHGGKHLMFSRYIAY